MKRFNFKFKHFKLILFLFLIFLIPSAFSSWVTFDLKANKIVNNVTLSPVCYVYTRDKQKVNYYSIEKALQKANSNETVYVIPETNPVIKYNCEIKSGVTLTIGGLTKGGNYLKDSNNNYTYADRGVVEEKNADSVENSVDNRGPHETANTLADATETLVAKYRKNSVKLEAILTNNGTINIGGRLSRESTGISDGTSGDYCEIVMTDNAVINNKGTIDCYGYIKKDTLNCTATIYNFNGSKVYQPFLISDFNGGTYSASCNIKNGDYIMPFNQWTLINIQVKSVFNYGSYMYGYYSVYNSTYKSILNITIYKGHKYGQINFIGINNSIFNINNGSIEIDFIDSNYKYTPVSANLIEKKMTIGIKGASEIEKMLIPCPMPDLQRYSNLTNADISTYINGFKINESTNIDINTFVFDENTNVVGVKENKYKITYSFDNTNKEYKYYTRDASGLVEGDPTIDYSKYNTNDRQVYKWKIDNNTNNLIDKNTEVDYLNNNKNINNLNINIWWMYRVEFIVNSVGYKPAIFHYDGKEYQQTIKLYIPEGNIIKVTIDSYFPATFKDKTKITTNPNIFSGHNSYDHSYNSGDQIVTRAISIFVSKS